MKSKIFFLIIVVVLLGFSLTSLKIFAQSEDQNLNDLQKKRQEYEQKLNELKNKEKTLKNEIAFMDTRINLTLTRIEEAKAAIRLREEELSRLGQDIGLVGGKIETLSKTLDIQRQVFASRAAASYKSHQVGSLEVFLGSSPVSSLSNLINRSKYLKTFELQDSKFLKQMEETRQVFQMQKIILTDKKDQVNEIKLQIEKEKKNLESYKTTLDRQKKEKQNLLLATSNDESKYQQLLSQVNAEIAAIRGFVSSRGGASILSNQTVCNDWGCYYNQRDSQWGLLPLGSSSLTVAEFGCLVSSSAMVASYYKRNLTPAEIAADASAFFSPDSGTAFLWKDFTVKNIRIVRTSLSPTTANIDAELSAGRPVIVGLYKGPAHFVVIKSGANGNYVMNDPFTENGHDVSFTSKYPLSAISDVERVSVN